MLMKIRRIKLVRLKSSRRRHPESLVQSYIIQEFRINIEIMIKRLIR